VNFKVEATVIIGQISLLSSVVHQPPKGGEGDQKCGWGALRRAPSEAWCGRFTNTSIPLALIISRKLFSDPQLAIHGKIMAKKRSSFNGILTYRWHFHRSRPYSCSWSGMVQKWSILDQTSQSGRMRFVKNFALPDFQVKDLTPLISLNFNSFSDKNTKNACFWRNLHHWQKNLHWRRQWQISSLFLPLWNIARIVNAVQVTHRL